NAAAPPFVPRTGKEGEIEVLPVQGNVYLLAGAGGNVAIQVGEGGGLVVDTGKGGVTEKVVAGSRQLSGKPRRIVINTDCDADHTGGNERLAKSGTKPGGGLVVGGSAGDGAMVISHEHVLNRMSAPTGKTPPAPQAAWPTDAYPRDTKDVYANGEG